MPDKLILLLEKMQNSFSTFQQVTNLSCPPGCGACCLSPDVEASPNELIPMALHIIKSGRMEEYLVKIENTEKLCLFYEPHSADGKKGKCTQYEHRPSLCRYFGVSGIMDKDKAFRYSICSELKKEYPELILELENKRPIPPLINDWMGELMSLDSELIMRQMPINEAFKEAFCKILLYQNLAFEVGTNPTTDQSQNVS
ncbi:MAG: YkgJ family cysteine cluster protein [Bacteriovoracaceae bacterium]